MAPRPRTLTVAILSLLLSGFAITSSAAAAPGADNECAGMTAQSHVVAGNTAPVANADSAPVLAGDFTVVDVLGNDTDAEGDLLSVITLTEPANGFACINGDGTIEYFSNTGTPTGTDQFTYGITDGDYFRTATVTMSIEGLDNVVPTLTRRLKLDRHGHVIRRARVSIVNTNDRTVEFFAGRFSSGLASFDKVIPGGETATLRTRLRHLDFVAVVPKDDGDFVLIDIGTLNTRTGKVVLESTDEFRQLERQAHHGNPALAHALTTRARPHSVAGSITALHAGVEPDESVAAAEQRLQAPILCESPSDAGSDHAVGIWPLLRRSGRTLHARGARAERRSLSEWWPATAGPATPRSGR